MAVAYFAGGDDRAAVVLVGVNEDTGATEAESGQSEYFLEECFREKMDIRERVM